MKIMRITVYLLCILLTAAAIAGCGSRAGAIPAAKNEEVPVKAMKVKLETLCKSLEYVGDIKGRDEAVVYPKVSGKVIEKIKEESDAVHKGDVIVYIDRDEVGLKFEKAPVESPLAGTIGRIYVDIGSTVTPQTPIAVVSDMEKAEIDVNIPEKYLPSVLLNQEAEIIVDAYPDEKFSGRVDMISPMVDLETRSAPVQITLDNAARRLQSGMFAKVKLTMEKRNNAPVILKEAVIGREPNAYVYVVENNKAVLRKVSLGIRQGQYFEVREGLKENEMVVVLGQQKLRDGSDVIVEVDGE